MSDNIYLPELARITHIKEEIGGERAIKTFRVEPVNGGGFEHTCGQCAMLSAFGRGEMMISIASSPLIKEYKQFSIMRVGRVSATFHELEVGDVIGIRGPYGNSFPIDDWRGKNLVFIGGGVGLAPIWPVITTALAQRANFKNITVFYGARSPSDLMYKADLER
ncbi:MAG TPA: hypothetical protein VKO66_01420, partial [Sideroxyarcus sp.]|nr:hypothetical protein [Sideroxyarcus sp.]